MVISHSQHSSYYRSSRSSFSSPSYYSSLLFRPINPPPCLLPLFIFLFSHPITPIPFLLIFLMLSLFFLLFIRIKNSASSSSIYLALLCSPLFLFRLLLFLAPFTRFFFLFLVPLPCNSPPSLPLLPASHPRTLYLRVLTSHTINPLFPSPSVPPSVLPSPVLPPPYLPPPSILLQPFPFF